MENENKNLVPAAIVVAGLIIAAAVYLRSPASPPATQNPTQPESALPALMTLASSKLVPAAQRPAFARCVEDEKYKNKIQAEMEEAGSLGAQGTPFPVIITDAGETMVLPGAVPFDTLKVIIDQLIAGKKSAEIIAALPTPEARQAFSRKLPKTLPPVTAQDHLKGDAKAPIKIVEYSDFDCPFCARFHGTMNQIIQTYGDKNQVAWIFRNLPLTSLHPESFQKAEIAECVNEAAGSAKYWEFNDRVFASHSQ